MRVFSASSSRVVCGAGEFSVVFVILRGFGGARKWLVDGWLGVRRERSYILEGGAVYNRIGRCGLYGGVLGRRRVSIVFFLMCWESWLFERI